MTPEQEKNREALADYGRRRSLMSNYEVAELFRSHERMLIALKEIKRELDGDFPKVCALLETLVAEAEKLQ